MAPRRATEVRALRAPYHTVLGDAIQLFQLIVINPAPIPIVYGAIETLIAEADSTTTTHQYDPSGQRQRTETATATEINVQIADTLSDLQRAVAVVIATSVLLAADSRDPRVQEYQRLLGDALTAIGGLDGLDGALPGTRRRSARWGRSHPGATLPSPVAWGDRQAGRQ